MILFTQYNIYTVAQTLKRLNDIQATRKGGTYVLYVLICLKEIADRKTKI